MRRRKVTLFLLAGALVFLALGAVVVSQNRERTSWPQLKTLEGRSLDISVNKRGPVIIHFWASWCGPCQEEFPTILKAKGLLPSHIRLQLVSLDDKPQDAEVFISRFTTERGEDLVGWDPDHRFSAMLGTNKMPETYVFDSNRRLVRKIAGAMNWLDPKNLSFLKSLSEN